jgi:hypothetical protein
MPSHSARPEQVKTLFWECGTVIEEEKKVRIGARALCIMSLLHRCRNRRTNV